MEGLSIMDLSMLPDEGEDLNRDMERLSISYLYYKFTLQK